MKKFVIITLVLIFVVMLLRKPDRFIKMTRTLNEQFRKAWLSLVAVK